MVSLSVPGCAGALFGPVWSPSSLSNTSITEITRMASRTTHRVTDPNHPPNPPILNPSPKILPASPPPPAPPTVPAPRIPNPKPDPTTLGAARKTCTLCGRFLSLPKMRMCTAVTSAMTPMPLPANRSVRRGSEGCVKRVMMWCWGLRGMRRVRMWDAKFWMRLIGGGEGARA